MGNFILLASILMLILSFFLYATKGLYQPNLDIKTLGKKKKWKLASNNDHIMLYVELLKSQQKKAFIGAMVTASLLGLTIGAIFVRWAFFSGSWEDISLIVGLSAELIGGSAFWIIYQKINKQIVSLIKT